MSRARLRYGHVSDDCTRPLILETDEVGLNARRIYSIVCVLVCCFVVVIPGC